jgi:antitoxin component YwqK of YwqJK toxin-antitoxin module
MTYDTQELLKQLTEELIDYINDKKYVYKTCGNYIVVLEKLEDTITNENRSNVSQIGNNKLYAKYRADKLFVKQIIHKYYLTKCEKVCSSGIHYFLNLKRAFYYEISMENMNGEYLNWYDSGEIYEKCNCIDGKINGEYFLFHASGEICLKYNYINGEQINSL